ncbi:uncharacterized protein Z520_08161 [Fonsecaea multimorphosa CBS 102226]|uniref:Uncharacterized protein n=1 Tax=Fonsecaea multimorphosa CBS 102226 TaxID=1442371 RepID=A0A0D2IFS1_9EURO|nr:uncharacterized protein Z520_08161 [Fonsecaea multimorphosa CBS 102226]KIX95906.1 hypothetical protein Z520_08161 [Fonsecaea multimorphosa CBS 102226]
MAAAPSTRLADDKSTHKSMAVSCTGVDDAGAAGVGGADFATAGVASALLRFTNSPPQSDPWHPQRADPRHLNHLIAEVDGILSAIKEPGARY